MIKRIFATFVLLLLPVSVNAQLENKVKYQADSVTNHQSADHKTENTVLSGNVKIEFANLKITTDQANFNLIKKELTINKNFQLFIDDKSSISGNELNIDITKKEITASILTIDAKLFSGKSLFNGLKLSAENNKIKINLKNTGYVLKAEQLNIQPD